MKVQISATAQALAARRRMQRHPFRDRAEAGQMLAERLQGFTGREDCLVLGLPSGGMVVANALSRLLRLPLDVLLSQPLAMPGPAAQVFGALAASGRAFLDYQLIRAARITPEQVAAALDTARAELRKRVKTYCKGKRPPEIAGKGVILVDDGSATGANLLAAVHALKRMRPAKVVVALPVCAEAACGLLEREADLLLALKRPSGFYAMEKIYTNFPAVGEEEVLQLRATGLRVVPESR